MQIKINPTRNPTLVKLKEVDIKTGNFASGFVAAAAYWTPATA